MLQSGIGCGHRRVQSCPCWDFDLLRSSPLHGIGELTNDGRGFVPGPDDGKDATEMTIKQKRVMDFVSQYWKEHYCPPSFREIMEGADISSTSMVAYQLAELRDAELLLDMERPLGKRVAIPLWVKHVIDRHLALHKGR